MEFACGIGGLLIGLILGYMLTQSQVKAASNRAMNLTMDIVVKLVASPEFREAVTGEVAQQMEKSSSLSLKGILKKGSN